MRFERGDIHEHGLFVFGIETDFATVAEVNQGAAAVGVHANDVAEDGDGGMLGYGWEIWRMGNGGDFEADGGGVLDLLYDVAKSDGGVVVDGPEDDAG